MFIELYGGFCIPQPVTRVGTGEGKCSTTLRVSAFWNFAPWVSLLAHSSLALEMTSRNRKANNLRQNNNHSWSLNFQAVLIPRAIIDHLLSGLPLSLGSSPLRLISCYPLGYNPYPPFPSSYFPLALLGHAPRDFILHLWEAVMVFGQTKTLFYLRRALVQSHNCRSSLYREVTDRCIWTMSLKKLSLESADHTLKVTFSQGSSMWDGQSPDSVRS